MTDVTSVYRSAVLSVFIHRTADPCVTMGMYSSMYMSIHVCVTRQLQSHNIDHLIKAHFYLVPWVVVIVRFHCISSLELP